MPDCLKKAGFFFLILILSLALIAEESASVEERPQLPESDFSQWHTEKLPGFLTFGKKECSEMPGSSPLCWDCGNPAFSASGSKNWPTRRIILPDGSTAALLTTRKVVGVIASGNLFTGRIVRNMSLAQLLGFTDDGKQLIDWGVPFTGRPKGFRVKFAYDGLGDKCSLVATLENRKEIEVTEKKKTKKKTERKYVATAAYISRIDFENETACPTRVSEKDENGLRTLEVDFVYGENPEGTNALPEGVVQADSDTEITHVNVVFASSARGDYFEGVKNASLIVKDFEFVY
ncbi:MAG: PCMD domain-containing protein [Treponema sp.]|nr:PCMD domain-containing protein [Treponema sp.]